MRNIFAKTALIMNLDSVNIRALKLFIEVFNSKSFSSVARKNGVSPSLVSRVITQLEETLGHQLFYRNTRAVIPTESGRMFIEYARSAVKEMTGAQQELQEALTEPSGLLRINAPVNFGQRHIAPWLADFSRRYTKIKIHLTLTDEYIDPHTDAADIIVRIGTLADSSLRARELGKQKYYLAASPDYAAQYGEPRSPSDLATHSCLVYSGYSGNNQWYFKTHNQPWFQQPLAPTFVSNNAEALLVSAINGMGIILFPDWLIGEYIKDGRLISLLEEYEVAINKEPQNISALYPQARHPSLNVRCFIDYLVEVYGTPPYWK